MKSANILTRFISQMLDLPVDVWDEDNSPRLFESQHCFFPPVQTQLSVSSLRYVQEHIQKQELLEIHDALGLRLYLFRFEEDILAALPFVEQEWNETEAAALLAKLNIPASYLVPYKLYYCRYHVVDRMMAVRAIQAGINALKPNSKPYTHRILLETKIEDDLQRVREETLGGEAVVRRYAAENEYIRMVKAGKPQEALLALGSLEQQDLGWGKRIYTSSDMRVHVSSITVLRTFLRKAAESGGVHPAIVDSISQAYAQKTYTVQNQADLAILPVEMTLAFCDEVQKVRQENFSPLIHKAVDYISLNLSNPLPLAEIAAQVQVTPNYLSHAFKKETGVPLSHYISKKKCEKAAKLLRYSDLPVQDISAYVGYVDNNYFVKVFKKHYGRVPTEYRKK